MANDIRINRGGDDAVSLDVSEGLRSDASNIRQTLRNTDQNLSLTEVIGKAMGIQESILVRMRELSLQSASRTVSDTERQTLQLKFVTLRSEFEYIAQNAKFKSGKILDGTLSSGINKQNLLSVQIKLENPDNGLIDLNHKINLHAMKSASLGFQSESISTIAGALSSQDKIDSALKKLNQARVKVETTLNRLTIAVQTLNVTIENLRAADSTVHEANIARELALLTRSQILGISSVTKV